MWLRCWSWCLCQVCQSVQLQADTRNVLMHVVARSPLQWLPSTVQSPSRPKLSLDTLAALAVFNLQ